MLVMSALMGARGVGSFIGPMLGAPLISMELKRLRLSIALGFSIACVGYLGLSWAPSLLFSVLAVVIGHAGTSMNCVFSSTLVQTLGEDRFCGRVTSAEFALMMTSISISTFLSGVAIDVGVSAQPVAGWSQRPSRQPSARNEIGHDAALYRLRRCRVGRGAIARCRFRGLVPQVTSATISGFQLHPAQLWRRLKI